MTRDPAPSTRSALGAKPKAFVTGGSGFIGTTLVDHLVRKGWTVLNLDVAPPKVERQRQHWVQGDIRDAEHLARTLADFKPDYVIHLAATTGAELKNPSPEHFDTNTQGVEKLIAAIGAAGSVRRTIYVSSLLVCPNGYIPEHDEDYCAPNAYGESKVVGEQIVRRQASAASEWAIVRPTSVWGPWFEHSYLTFFKLVGRGLYFHIRGARDLIKPKTYVGNTAHMLERLLTAGSNAVARRTFYLGDYPESSVGEWADAVQRATGARKVRTLPLWPIRLAAEVGDVLKFVGWSNPPITSFRLSNLMTGGRYPLSPIREVAGDLPYELDAAVAETVSWMREQNLLR